MKIRIIVIALSIMFVSCSCTSETLNSASRQQTMATANDKSSTIKSNNNQSRTGGSSSDIPIEFGNINDIVLKTITVQSPQYYYAMGVKDNDSIYCLDTNKYTGVREYNLKEKKGSLLRGPVNRKRVIKSAYISGDWVTWEEDEDKIMYDYSYGKNWAVYAQNIMTGELIEIDKEKKLIKTGNDSVLGYTAPERLSISGNKIVYTIFDILDDGNIYQVIKMYDLEQKKSDIIDSKKDYKNGFYAFPNISGDYIVWSWSDCNLKFQGSENGHIYLYNIKTSNKSCLTTDRDDILWPVISNNYIAARVKPNGNNENSSIVLYNMNGDRKWRTVISPESSVYKNETHVEISQPEICGKYLTWSDNIRKDLLIFDISKQKLYKLYESKDYQHMFQMYFLLNKALSWNEMEYENNNSGELVTKVNNITLLK